MSERKTIQINPKLFEVNNKTRQKKPKLNNKIKMNSKLSSPAKNKSLKNGILKMIREKQQNEYQKLFSDKLDHSNSNAALPASDLMKISGVDNFKNEFEQSINYLNSLEKKNPPKPNPPPKNQTLKQYPSNSISTNFSGAEYENVNLVLPNSLNEMPPMQLRRPVGGQSTMYNQKPLPSPSDMPKYGCMKYGGKLNTYRTMMNLTQKNQKNNGMSNSMNIPNTNYTGGALPAENTSLEENSILALMKDSQIERIKHKTAIKQMKTQIDALNKPPKMKQLKQRRIARRTYRVGKSKVLPRVSVLVSNRTLRNNITTKTQMLKQTSMNEIRRFLIKRGFIKVGSNAPNDVLRKMYESISLICGEVQNHNSENLLYNYLHS